MSTEFAILRTPTGRKQHICAWCAGPIPKGEKHKHFIGIWDGDFQNWRMHDECFATSAGAQEQGFTPGEGVMPKRIADYVRQSKPRAG
jgi:hypothetical protein